MLPCWKSSFLDIPTLKKKENYGAFLRIVLSFSHPITYIAMNKKQLLLNQQRYLFANCLNVLTDSSLPYPSMFSFS